MDKYINKFQGGQSINERRAAPKPLSEHHEDDSEESDSGDDSDEELEGPVDMASGKVLNWIMS